MSTLCCVIVSHVALPCIIVMWLAQWAANGGAQRMARRCPHRNNERLRVIANDVFITRKDDIDQYHDCVSLHVGLIIEYHPSKTIISVKRWTMSISCPMLSGMSTSNLRHTRHSQ